MTDIIYPGATYGFVDARADLDAKADLKVLSAPASSTDHWTHLITSQVFGELLEPNSDGDIPDYKNWNVTVELTSKNMWLVF